MGRKNGVENFEIFFQRAKKMLAYLYRRSIIINIKRGRETSRRILEKKIGG